MYEENLRNILVKWCENLRVYNHDHGLFFYYIEKQGGNFTVETISRDECCNAINEFENNELNEIIKLCWQIFRFNIEKKDLDSNTNSNNNNNLTPSKTTDSPLFNEINIRRILSFIRDFAVILQINSRIFFVDKTLGIKKIPLYVALYSRYIAYFRSVGFAAVLNIIGDQWRIKRLGIFEDISKRTNFTQSENEDYQFFVLYTNLEIIYYQTSFGKLTDELYLETLLDAFKLNRYVILLHKLNTSYFAQNTREVLALLFDNEDVDSGKIIKFFEKVLSDDFLFRRDIENKLKVWNDIYCQVLIHYSENILFVNKYRSDLFNDIQFYKQLYDFLDKILYSKIKNDSTDYIKFLELMISFLRILVYQFTSFYGPESISFFIYCVKNYIKKNQAYLDLKTEGYSSNDVENTLNNDFISLPEYIKNTVLFDADKKQCYIYVDGGNVARLVNKLKDKHDLFKDINRLPLVFFIKYNHRNTPDLTLLYSYPISKKMRLFYVNHFCFSFENLQSLFTLFCELTKWFIYENKLDYELIHRIKKSEIRSDERNDNSFKFCKSILRCLYTYVLLASNVFRNHNKIICNVFFDKLEEEFSSTITKLGLSSLYEDLKINNRFCVDLFELPPFIRLVIMIIFKFDLHLECLLHLSFDKSESLVIKQKDEESSLYNKGLADNNEHDNNSLKSEQNQHIGETKEILHVKDFADSEVHTNNQNCSFNNKKENDALRDLQEENIIINSINFVLKGVGFKNDKFDIKELNSYIKDEDEQFYVFWLIFWKRNFCQNRCCQSLQNDGYSEVL